MLFVACLCDWLRRGAGSPKPRRSAVALVAEGMESWKHDSEGPTMNAKRSRHTAPFGLPAVGARVLTRIRWALRRSRTGRENDIEDRIRKVEAELEEARRLEGIGPPRATP